MSWAPQVIADSTGKWFGNQLRFATKREADLQVYQLAMRWTSVVDFRSVESTDPVNYRYDETAGLVPVEQEKVA